MIYLSTQSQLKFIRFGSAWVCINSLTIRRREFDSNPGNPAKPASKPSAATHRMSQLPIDRCVCEHLRILFYQIGRREREEGCKTCKNLLLVEMLFFNTLWFWQSDSLLAGVTCVVLCCFFKWYTSLYGRVSNLVFLAKKSEQNHFVCFLLCTILQLRLHSL